MKNGKTKSLGKCQLKAKFRAVSKVNYRSDTNQSQLSDIKTFETTRDTTRQKAQTRHRLHVTIRDRRFLFEASYSLNDDESFSTFITVQIAISSSIILHQDLFNTTTNRDQVCRLSMAWKYSLLAKTPSKRIFQPKSIAARWPRGCRGGVTNAIILGISTLILNIAITSWLLTENGFDHNLVTMKRMSCESSRRVITLAQLIINILASLLLAASNYCMQILSSPRREEVDAAHAANEWLSIGVPNCKNLRYLPWTRRLLLLILALCSLPVHLLWNSAILLEEPANNYLVAAVSQEFVSGAPINATSFVSQDLSEVKSIEERLKSLTHNSTNLTAAKCITNYAKELLSDYSNLALVTSVHNSSNSLLGLWEYDIRTPSTSTSEILYPLAMNWPCSIIQAMAVERVDCNLAELATSNATNWSPFPGHPWNSYPSIADSSVNYCLAQSTHRTCRISLTPTIVWIVLAANLSKVVCFYGTFLLLRNSSDPLITTGDAVQSFLSKPDPKLSQRCLSSVSEVKNDLKFWAAPEMPLQWLPRRQVGLYGAPLSSWLWLFLPAVTGIGCVTWLYILKDLNGFLSFGFSSTNKSELITQVDNSINFGVVAGTLLANTPQIILSYIYTAYNALITSMLSHSELLSYSTKRRGLRVTQPTQMQRSSYYLSLPYRFSIPLITASAILHWLVSESFFLVRVIAYGQDGTEDPEELISAVGFSSYAIVVSLAVMAFMLLAILILGLGTRYSSTMPLAATCSASIATMCQPVQGAEFKVDLAKLPLSWGTVDQESAAVYDEYGRPMKHATFSSEQVSPLVKKASYQ